MIYNNAGISGLTGPDSHESPDILQRLDMYRGYPTEKLGPIASNGDLAAVSVLADRKDQERRQKENAAKNPTTTAIEDLLAMNNMPVGSNSLPEMPQGRPGMQGADTAMPNMGSPPGAGMIGAPSSPGMGLASQGPPTGSQMPPAGFNPQGGQGQPPVMGAKDGGLVDTFRRSGVRGFSKAGSVPQAWYQRKNADGSDVPTHLMSIDELLALRDSKLANESARRLTPQNRTSILPGVTTLPETIRRNSQPTPGGNLYGPRDPFQIGGAHFPERRSPSERNKGRVTRDEVRAVEKDRESGPSDFDLGMGNDEELTALIKSMELTPEELWAISPEERLRAEQSWPARGRELPAEYAEAGLTMADYEADQAWLAANNNGVDESKNEEFQAPVDADYGPGGRNVERGMKWLSEKYQEQFGDEGITGFVKDKTDTLRGIASGVHDEIINSEEVLEGDAYGLVTPARDAYRFASHVVTDGMSGDEVRGFWSDEVTDLFGGDEGTTTVVADNTAPVVDQSGGQSGDPATALASAQVGGEAVDPKIGIGNIKFDASRNPAREDRLALANAGRLDVTAMDKFMDKIEEMQRGKRGMALLAMAAEMSKYHKGGFLPSAVAGMNAAGQSARDTDTQALKGYGLGAEMDLQKQRLEDDYEVGMNRNAVSAENARIKAASYRDSAAQKVLDRNDGRIHAWNVAKQGDFSKVMQDLRDNSSSHQLESLMMPYYESQFGDPEMAKEAFAKIRKHFHGGSIFGGDVTKAEQMVAEIDVRNALKLQIETQQVFMDGNGGGGEQRDIGYYDAFLQGGDV